jgi:hypothetical protein
MATSRIEGDQYINGVLTPKQFSPPASCITDAAIAAGAGIDASKVDHQHHPGFSQPNAAATSETRAIFVCRGNAGSVEALKVGSIGVAVGNATVTVDLKKNGTSILTGVVTLNSSNTARVSVSGTLTGSNALVAGDLLEIVIVATIGTGTLPTGVYAFATVNEEAQ